jgi:hypothetical protein
MVGNLSLCTREEQHAVIYFLWAEVKVYQGQKSYFQLSALYGNNVLTWQNICNWIEKLKTGHMCVMDEEWSTYLTVTWDSQGPNTGM